MTKKNKRGIMALAAAAAMLAAGTWTVPAGAAENLSSWHKSIANRVAKKHVYPRRALASEIEGTAKVRVMVTHDGAIQSYEVLESTGHAVLDRELEKLMKRIDPLPRPPAEASDDDLSLVLPIAWVIQ